MSEVLQEKVPTDASLAVGGRLASPEVSDRELLKYLYHPEIGYRIAAMRSIVSTGRDKVVMPLLKAGDPRLRHAGLLAITGMFKGSALPDDKVTPEMFEQVGAMIEDPSEALWVVQEALKAMARANPEKVAKHRAAIFKYMGHEDWFLRTSAIAALEPIWISPDYYKEVLPPVFKTLAHFTTGQALSPAWKLKKTLAQTSPQVKAFAMQELQKAYTSVPSPMTFPGGYTMSDGARAVRSQLSGMMSGLPGGDSFIKTMPKMTTTSARTGNESDMYSFSGTFTPNPRVVGTWNWAVWPRPKSAEQVEKSLAGWVERMKKGNKEKPKDVITLSADGKVKSGFYKGYFWSGDMLIGTDDGLARKMELRTVAGKDFLIIEAGGFDPEDIPTEWDKKYTIYMRVK